MRYRAYLRDGTNVGVSGSSEQEALDNAYEQYGEEPLRLVSEKDVMDKNIQDAQAQVYQQENPAMSTAYPYTAKNPGSNIAAVKDGFSMPGRLLTTIGDSTFEDMKITSEEHAKNGNPFLEYLTSPTTGAITTATLPFIAAASAPAAAMFAVPAAAGIAAGYGFEEGSQYGLDDAGIELLASAVGAALPLGGAKLARTTVIRALAEKGITPTKEIMDKIMDRVMEHLKRSGSLKSAGSKVGAEYSGKIAKDARISYQNAIPPKEEAIGQIRSGMSGKMTAQQAMANEQRMNSLYQKLDYINQNSVPTPDNPMGYMSPESIRSSLQDLLVEYRDLPEAVEVIRKTFSSTYRSPHSMAVEEIVTGRPVPGANMVPWEDLAPGIAVGRALESGVPAQIIPTRWIPDFPVIEGGLEKVGPRSAIRATKVAYPIPATLGQLYGPNEDQVP